MIKYKVDDILANLIAQLSGYKQDMDIIGLKIGDLCEVIELLVNETSKLKSILLEMPSKEDVN